MRYWISLLFVVSMLLTAAGLASAATVTPQLILDGVALTPKEPPALIDSRVMLPVRTVTESLGYTVKFDNATKTLTVSNGNSVIVMTVGSKKATINGIESELEAAPIIKQTTPATATTMVPLIFVKDNFGADIVWDNKTKSAFIYTSKPGSGGSSGGTSEGGGNGDSASGGGMIGVVDEDPPATDGSTDAGNGTTVTDPYTSLAYIHGIRFENETVILSYEGTVQPVVTSLTGPDRIVVDVPKSDFASDFAQNLVVNGTTAKSGAYPIASHPVLTQVRYSLFQTNPNALRFVLDLSSAYGYEVQNDTSAGELRIKLSADAVPPVTPPPTDTPQNKVYTVVLDAGHGGSDSGAIGVSGKYEKNFNLAIILKVQALLATDPRIKIVMTRSGDTFPSLSDRYNLANSIKADLFLSVHANSNTKNTVSGTEVYYTRADSLAFANVVKQYATPATGLTDRGVIQKSLAVTRETKMPAVLFEAGYLSNATEEKKLFTEDFQNRTAAGLAAAVKAYLKLA
ncbi:N-acetylmuramoyl-L-alanine amidase [Cohnella hashimotonis]|uniref:N-acetylmuramoyl-L-alanine amidase n=1 Tax=Cohnella hashimotonis TaxID=2826895 RepID=A0ABT6TI73_9BACL|nr:N-acetylmuramoyl-L-alanine amidase [Cohnella hashimotonis]MDI4645552.1 N-acetylmuramoyl-L-alanine amidase [Cohnella hashimotonis]